MEWLEVNQIPQACSDCKQEDCYNCDVAGQRWTLTEEKALLAKRKLLMHAIRRIEREIAEIDTQLMNSHK